MRSGFISSIIAVSFMSLLILLWLTFQQASINFEMNISETQPISYAGYYFDHVFYDIKNIVGPATILTYENATAFTIYIADSMPKLSFNAALANYKNYLETNVSSRIHGNISLNTANMTNGTYLITTSGFNYIFNYTNSSSNSVSFIKTDGAINLAGYVINVSVAKNRQAILNFANNPGGDINATINYIDNNGITTNTVMLLSTSRSASTVTYMDNSTLLIQIGDPVNAGTLAITDNNAGPAFSFSAYFMPNSTFDTDPQYNAQINYTQGKINRFNYVRR